MKEVSGTDQKAALQALARHIKKPTGFTTEMSTAQHVFAAKGGRKPKLTHKVLKVGEVEDAARLHATDEPAAEEGTDAPFDWPAVVNGGRLHDPLARPSRDTFPPRFERCSMLRALLILSCCAIAARGDDRPVTIRFVGGAKKVPLEGLKVSVRRHTGDWAADRKKTLAVGRTDRGGRVGFRFPAGRYDVDIESDREVPYLDRPVGFKSPPDLYSRTVEVGAASAFEFNLADACRLTLRAVDVDTGKGLPGAVFVTENALAEVWALPIRGDNLGVKRGSGTRPGDHEKTDRDGNFTRLIGPRHGYTYYVWAPPPGYEIAGEPEEVELRSHVGTDKAGHVFRFRKKKGLGQVPAVGEPRRGRP